MDPPKEHATPENLTPIEGPSDNDSVGDDFKLIDPQTGIKRGLKTRHLSMMALAGIIGPGLLIGAGGALASGGPASLIIGFGVIGVIAFRYVLLGEGLSVVFQT